MTVSYTGEAYSAGLAVYLRLLFRYRGSVYKAAYGEFIIFGGLYVLVFLIYRFLLKDPQKWWMELCIISVSRIMNQIPIGFVLGFYVSLIYRRFWKHYLAIPSPNKTAIFFSTYLNGVDEHAVLMRRTALRYVCAAFVLAMRRVNIPIRNRFPTVDHIGNSGLLTKEELETYKKVEEKCQFHASFLPLVWSSSIARRAFDKGKIKSTAALHDILRVIDDFRSNCQTVFNYDEVNVPLCYTQAVTFGCYSYFVAAILGYQFIEEDRVVALVEHGMKVPSTFNRDFIVPVFAIIQFFIYIGLMKVAEALLNPHGENDDDFEMSNQVDKNLINSYLIVTDMHNDLPDLEQDKYWDSALVELPYTYAAYHAQGHRPDPGSHFGSLFKYSVKRGSNFISSLTQKDAKIDTEKLLRQTSKDQQKEELVGERHNGESYQQEGHQDGTSFLDTPDGYYK